MDCFLFTLPGRKVGYGPRRGEFIWVEKYHAFVYKGKPVVPSKFNETFAYIFERYRDEGATVTFLQAAPLTEEELVNDALVTLRVKCPEVLKPKYAKKHPTEQPSEVVNEEVAAV